MAFSNLILAGPKPHHEIMSVASPNPKYYNPLNPVLTHVPPPSIIISPNGELHAMFPVFIDPDPQEACSIQDEMENYIWLMNQNSH